MADSRPWHGSLLRKQTFFNFLFGIVLGSVVTHIVLKFSVQDFTVDGNLKVLLKAKYSSPLVSNYIGTTNHHAEDADVAILGEDALRTWMASRVRVLCWILTHPGNLKKKAVHVKATWTRRCNIVLFISSEDTDFPTIAVVDHEQEGRTYLWQKTRGAFDYIYKHYFDKADWFLKADDDTYVIVENLRKFVSSYDPEKPIFFGRKFKRPPNGKIVFMQGGAGYVLSRKALELLVKNIFNNPKYAHALDRNPPEDVMISKLLAAAGVEEGHSRDGTYERFHPAAPGETIVPHIVSRRHTFRKFNFYPIKMGLECCSNDSISFHYVTPDTMYWLEYMVYHLRPFGVGYHACPVNIRSIMGIPESPSSSHMNAIEGHSITKVENKTRSPDKKSEDRQK